MKAWDNLDYNKHMDTNTTFANGTISVDSWTITFSTGLSAYWNSIVLYNCNEDDEVERNYATIKEVIETVALLLASETAREEFYNA